MQQTPGGHGDRHPAVLARALPGSPDRPGRRGGRRAVRARVLLARPGLLHLEHRHRRGPGRDPGPVDGGPRPGRPHRLPGGAGQHPDHGAGCRRGLDRVRDLRRPRAGTPPAGRWQGLDVADDAVRAHRPRGAGGSGSAAGRRARGGPGPADLAGAPRGRGRRAGVHPAALRAGRRGRAGRHRAGCPAAAARRAHRRGGPARPARGPVAQPLQVAVPARPGLVRPPALPAVPGELAGLRPQGQDRGLAGDVHEGDGAELLELHHGGVRGVGRGRGHLDGAADPRGRAAHPAPDRAGVRHRHVGQGPDAAVPRDGPLPRRAAALLGPPRPGGLPGQAGGRRGVQQLRPRHLRRAVGERRRRHDGAAQLHLGGAQRGRAAVDGRHLLRGGARRRDDHGSG